MSRGISPGIHGECIGTHRKTVSPICLIGNILRPRLSVRPLAEDDVLADNDVLTDDDEDRAGDGDEGLELAGASGQAPVARAEEGAGPRGRGSGLAEHAQEVWGAVAVAAGSGLDAGSDGAW